MTSVRSRSTLLAAAVAALLVAAGCGSPGSSNGGSQHGPASTGFDTSKKVTITMWDTETSPGPSKAEDLLIKQFEAKYPNVTVKRVVKNFDDYVATIKLAASSADAPDVFQGNEGYGTDQPLVKAHLIVPLDSIAMQYGWDTRFGSSATLNPLRWSNDGSTWGIGTLWGVAQKAEVVGAFYNKATLRRLGLTVPKTFADFEHSLAVAKAAGVPGIMVGNLDRWPMGHVFMVLQSRFEDPTKIANWTYGRSGSTFDDAGTRKAAGVLQQWADAGYFENGFNGVSQQTAAARFGKGEGLYFITGPWENETFAGPMGDGVGFFPLPSLDGSSGAPTTGALSLPFHISAHSQHKDVAAAFIDFITSPAAAAVVIRNGDLPAAAPAGAGIDPNSSLAAISAAWLEKSKAGTLTPYLDWATATMGDTLFGDLQSLTSDKMTPAQFTASVQSDWEKSHS